MGGWWAYGWFLARPLRPACRRVLEAPPRVRSDPFLQGIARPLRAGTQSCAARHRPHTRLPIPRAPAHGCASPVPPASPQVALAVDVGQGGAASSASGTAVTKPRLLSIMRELIGRVTSMKSELDGKYAPQAALGP